MLSERLLKRIEYSESLLENYYELPKLIFIKPPKIRKIPNFRPKECQGGCGAIILPPQKYCPECREIIIPATRKKCMKNYQINNKRKILDYQKERYAQRKR